LALSVIALNELLMPIVLRHALVASGEAGQRAPADFSDAPVEPAEATVATSAGGD
jgi:hypothetical protein